MRHLPLWARQSLDASLSGDEVELIAFNVAKCGPAGFALFDVLDLLRAETAEPVGLGLELGGDEVEMESVLHRLRFGHLVKREARPVDAGVVDEHDRVFSRWVVGYLASEDLGPEVGDRGGVDAIDGDAEEGVAHLGVLLQGCDGAVLRRWRSSIGRCSQWSGWGCVDSDGGAAAVDGDHRASEVAGLL